METTVVKVEQDVTKTAAPVVAEVKGFLPVLKSKIKSWRLALDAEMVKLGKAKTSAILVAGWLVYFLVGRFVIGFSAKVVAAITKVVLSVIPAAVLAIPYLVLLAIILVTVAFVVDILLKKAPVQKP